MSATQHGIVSRGRRERRPGVRSAFTAQCRCGTTVSSRSGTEGLWQAFEKHVKRAKAKEENGGTQ